jgi:hypothetical protein
MWVGLTIHAALEGMYAYGDDPVQLVGDIYDMYLSKFDIEDPAQAFKHLGMSKDRDLAQIMVEGYVQWSEEEGIDSDLEIIGAEQHIVVPSRIAGVQLQGKIDVRARKRSDGRNVFVDHKTVAGFDNVLKTIDISEQFKFYSMLEALAGDGTMQTDGGIINMLRRVKRTTNAKPPFYKRTEVRFNKAEMSAMWKRTHAMIEQMMDIRARLAAGQDHHTLVYPSPSGDCSWSCEFLDVCAMFDDGSRVEDAVKRHYVQHDPLARYNETPLRDRVNERKLVKNGSGS